MKIGIPSNPSLLSLKEVKPALNNWKVGQTLQAVVVDPKKVNKQAISLQIGALRVEVKNVPTPPTPLFKGQNLKLEIMSLSPLPVLKVLTESKIDLKNEAIRNFLPKQAAYPALLANLHALSTPKTRLQEEIPASLQKIINQLIDRLPTPSSVSSPQGLKSNLNNSGIFFEQQALKQKNTADKPIDFTKDFKANLLTLAAEIKQQLAKEGKLDPRPFAPPSTHNRMLSANSLGKTSQTLQTPLHLPDSAATQQTTERKSPAIAIPNTEKNSPPPLRHTPVVAQGKVFDSLTNLSGTTSLLSELLEFVDSGLSRLRLTQLANTQIDNNNSVYLFELPVKDQNGIDLINLKLEQEQRNKKNKNQQGWNITLAFNFEELGPVYAHIRLRGKKVNTNISSEYNTTKLLFEKHLDKLKESLSKAGMEIDNICCSQGKIEQRNIKTHISPILDTRA